MLKCQNGLTSVSRTFSGLLVPMAQYVLTKMMKIDIPIIATTNGDYNKKISLTDIQTDVNKTEVAINGLTAFYDNKIITAMIHYGDFIVTAYAPSREEAKEWQDNFEMHLISDNQYRGKCLYAAGGSFEYRDVPSTKWDDVILTEKLKNDIRLNTSL